MRCYVPTKRITGLLLLIALQLYVSSSLAIKNGNYEYIVENGSSQLVKYLGSNTSLTIPSSLGGYPVTVIAEKCFNGNKNLQTVSIPSSVKVIGKSAFSLCLNLKKVSLPSGLQRIEDGAFSNTSIGVLTIPYSVSFIGEGAFQGSGLERISLNCNIKEISKNTFAYCSSLQSITLPSNIESIGEYAFFRCSELESISFKTGLVSIKKWAFSNCTNLRKVSFSPNLETIEEYAFEKCSSLEDLVFPKNLQRINSYAFMSCEALNTIQFQTSQDELILDNYAFYICENLKRVEFMDGIKRLNGYPFESCGIESIILPSTLNEIDAEAIVWLDELCSVEINRNNKDYYSIDGVVYDKYGTLIAYPPAKTDKEFITTTETKQIGNVAFANNHFLKRIVLTDSITTIGKEAFYAGSQLNEIIVHGKNTSFSDVLFFNDDINVYAWEGSQFIDCMQKIHPQIIVKYIGGDISHGILKLPQSIKRIEKYAFNGIRATFFKFPKGIFSITKETAEAFCQPVSIEVNAPITMIERNAFEEYSVIYAPNGKGSVYFTGKGTEPIVLYSQIQ